MARNKKNYKNRNNKNRNNKNRNKGGNVFIPKFYWKENQGVSGRYAGVLEINEKGWGLIRKLDYEFSYSPQDPFLKPEEVKSLDLRPGLILEGEYEEDKRGNKHVYSVDRINRKDKEAWTKSSRFERQTPIMPVDWIKLGEPSDNIEMRVIDLVAPIGKGQRALIVAPPRTGKTVMLKQIAKSITENHPDIPLSVLLVDERPEEVTDFIRSTDAEVFASSNDNKTQSHIRITEMALGYAKRKAEMGEDSVLLIDSLTRLGRAYNAIQTNSGRTLSGGLDIRALEIPKKIFGSARKIEGGGSLTIIATCLIETNSRMDDLIFEEFKGTGNMELVLDRELANDRIYPSINITASGTRNEEKFITDSLEERNMVRRYLLKKSPKESMLGLLKVLNNTESNQELLNQIAATS
ncbi:MAG: transcription termination factor Rho [Balneola sp.]|nr:transcription termination factor Rho [Balneola sp.]MBO6649703.1 transcription termination factor Rho [Balneola sp.]MBO6712265.1 transcription termination factor Rho [Balneola sp.]MBO6800459.1 transcription termination factor Rho [Balneola sp.]MBO6871413.1 transcription termination factor Rho [Balneola sp.]